MTILTRKELENKGYVLNPNLWLGSGYIYCSNCKDYHMHYGMSKSNGDYVIVCFICDTARINNF